MLSREFITRYFKPQLEDLTTGTTHGLDSDRELSRALATPGLDAPAIGLTIESEFSETHLRNCESLCAEWPAVWRRVSGALMKVIADYGYTEALATDPFTLTVHLPDAPFTADTEWSIGLEFASGAGIYHVQLRGWTEITDSGATF